MKSATFPSLRVDSELRRAAELVLEDGESISGFVEESIRANIKRRLAHREFIARGLRSRDEARLSNTYVSSEAVLDGLQKMLESAKSRAKTGE